MSISTDESTQFPPTVLRAIGLGEVAVFTVIGYLLFENIGFGLVVGLLSGVGTVWFLAWTTAANQEGPVDRQVGTAGLTDRIHRGAAGAGLMGAAVVAIAMMFVLEDVLFAVGIGLGLAIVEYPILSRIFPADNR